MATDPSCRQLARARRGGRGLWFAGGRAESAPLPDACADLITVGQAIHWFDLHTFYSEVRRIARPDAVVSAWTYHFLRVSPEIDAVVDRFAHQTVGAYWPPERDLVERSYADLPFPFDRLEVPSLEMTARWELCEILGYLGTWSAVNRYRRDRSADPLPPLQRELESIWGEGSRRIRWPFTVLAGRVSPS